MPKDQTKAVTNTGLVTKLLAGLKVWLQNVENAEEGRKALDITKSGMHQIAVNELFNQISLIIVFIHRDPEGWKDVIEFIKRESPSYRSFTIHGCLNVLRNIGELFSPK